MRSCAASVVFKQRYDKRLLIRHTVMASKHLRLTSFSLGYELLRLDMYLSHPEGAAQGRDGCGMHALW